MSLINDALKRAKEAQQQAAPPPAPNLEFRPVELVQLGPPSRGLMVPAVLAGAALLILLLAWQWSQKNDSAAPIEVKSRTAAAAKSAPAPQPAAASAAPAPAAPVAAVQPVPDIPSVPGVPPTSDQIGPVGPSPLSDTNSPVGASPDGSVANTAAVAEPAPPKPPPLKLQAIVFSRTRPSVMINGKTLFLGDKLNGSRVTAIDQESATLVASGQTNVLTLQSE
jgi:hypothetical protein